MPAADLGRPLLAIARNAIAAEFGLPVAAVATSEALDRPGATFVTLTQDGELRGCVGTLEAVRPLRIDVQRNAIGAAFRDTRFAPLTRAEFESVAIEVSLLTPSEPLRVAGEEDLLARLRPGIDGLTIEYGHARATFLPQVWESLPRPRDFLDALRQKAGLPRGFWHASMNVSRYQVAKWKETELQVVRDDE